MSLRIDELRKDKTVKKRRTNTSFSLTMTVVCIAFVVVGVLCATRLYDINQRKARLMEESRQLQAQKQALLDRNDALLAQGAHSDDDVYVEKVARDQLDMVYPGEIIFRVSGE